MVSKDEMIAFFRSEFPKARYVIEDFTDDSVVRHQVGEQDLRPGGTVSGPTMMALADTALYVHFCGKSVWCRLRSPPPQLQFSEKASG